MESVTLAEKLIKTGFTWGRAVDPNPMDDFWLGVAGQGLGDLANSSLCINQRITRGAVVGLESGVTGVASDVVGCLGFLGGEALFLEGGCVIGYGGGSLLTTGIGDLIIWPLTNKTSIFPSLNAGQ